MFDGAYRAAPVGKCIVSRLVWHGTHVCRHQHSRQPMFARVLCRGVTGAESPEQPWPQALLPQKRPWPPRAGVWPIIMLPPPPRPPPPPPSFLPPSPSFPPFSTLLAYMTRGHPAHPPSLVTHL